MLAVRREDFKLDRANGRMEITLAPGGYFNPAVLRNSPESRDATFAPLLSEGNPIVFIKAALGLALLVQVDV